MKWMWSTAVVVAAVSAAVGAQSAKDGDRPAMGDRMNRTYTGCVEAVNHGGSFLLTHVGDGHDKGMKDDMAMKKDMGTMNTEASHGSNDMNMDHMMPSAVALTGSSDLKKHVGQRVTVTGSLSNGSIGTMRNDLDTLAVGSLKVVAKSCS